MMDLQSNGTQTLNDGVVDNNSRCGETKLLPSQRQTASQLNKAIENTPTKDGQLNPNGGGAYTFYNEQSKTQLNDDGDQTTVEDKNYVTQQHIMKRNQYDSQLQQPVRDRASTPERSAYDQSMSNQKEDQEEL